MSAVTASELREYTQRISDLGDALSQAEWTSPTACRAMAPLTTDLAAAALTLRERLRLYIRQADANPKSGRR